VSDVSAERAREVAQKTGDVKPATSIVATYEATAENGFGFQCGPPQDRRLMAREERILLTSLLKECFFTFRLRIYNNSLAGGKQMKAIQVSKFGGPEVIHK
jgi:hypothetical protein